MYDQLISGVPVTDIELRHFIAEFEDKIYEMPGHQLDLGRATSQERREYSALELARKALKKYDSHFYLQLSTSYHASKEALGILIWPRKRKVFEVYSL